MLKLTAPLLITATTGQNRPLGESSQIRHYLAAGDHAKLRRRLEADLKALYTFYRYGGVHGYVRLRWGFLDDRLPVDWALRGDVGLYEILEDALRHGQPVDVVFSPAPGWRDPWARAHRVEVLRIDHSGSVALRDGAGMLFVDQADIQAARPARHSSFL